MFIKKKPEPNKTLKYNLRSTHQLFQITVLRINMSYYVDQLTKYKTALAEQNEMIISTQNSLKETKLAYRSVYSALASMKAEFNSGKSAIEKSVYPDLKPEDPLKLSLETCQTNLSRAVNALTASLGEHRTEFNAFGSTIENLQIDAEVEKFNALRLGSNSVATGNSFLGGNARQTENQRPKTPEVELGTLDRLRNAVNLPPTPPESTGGKEKRSGKDKKPSSPTVTLGQPGIMDTLGLGSSKQKPTKEEKSKTPASSKK